VRGVEKAKGLDGIEDVIISIPTNQQVVPLPHGSRYLGFIFARAETPDRVETALRAAHQELRFHIN
jgi:hypothetical protein